MKRSNQKGSALIIVLVVLVLVTIIGLAFTQRGASVLNMVGQKLRKSQTDYFAEEALEKGFLKIIDAINNGDPIGKPQVEQANFDGSLAWPTETYDSTTRTYEYQTSPSHDQKYRIRYRINVTSGWADKPGDVFERAYTVEAAVIGPNDTGSILSQDIIVRREPFYKYSVFCDNDCEITFDGAATLRGRIHSNQNVFIENKDPSPISIIGTITAAGHIMRSELGTIFNTDRGAINISWESMWVATPTLFSALLMGQDAITPLNGSFVPFDIKNPAKENVTWAVDSTWKSNLGQAIVSRFNGVVLDSTMGIKKQPVPPMAEFEPIGYYKDESEFVVNTIRDSSDSSKIILKVYDGVSGSPFVEKTFDVSAIGEARQYDAIGNPGTAEFTTPSDPAVTCLGNCRGKPKTDGTTVTDIGGCADAFSQERVWSAHEDMFVYNTRIDVQTLQNCSKYPSNGLVYAYRSGDLDAQKDALIETTQKVDPDRRPYGYVLHNGDTLKNNTPLFFVSDNPVTIRGNFNRHQTSTNVPIDPNDPGYNRTADTWQSAAILADKVTVDSPAYDVPFNNRFRRHAGASGECATSTCYIPNAADVEVNAAFIAGQNPTMMDYTNYVAPISTEWKYSPNNINASPLAGTGTHPKGGGGLSMFIPVEEDFYPSLTGPKMKFWGTFLQLFKPKYATNFVRECKPQAANMFNPSSSSYPNYCGVWAKGGTGGGIQADRRNNRTYNYDPNLLKYVPNSFKELFPATWAVSVPPFEKANYKRGENPKSLFPPGS